MRGVCEAPLKADAVADGVGVNIHLHFGDTVYGNFPLIQQLLVDLGVRHTRDGMIDTTWQPYYDRHTALGKLGIKCLLITDPQLSNSVLTSYPSRIPGAFEGYEGPNEYDANGGPNWAQTLQAYIPRLYSAVRSNPATAQYMIVAPSLTKADSYQQVTGLDQYFAFANMHNYFGGRNPGTSGWGSNGYGSISWNMNNVAAGWPSKPITTTETGYITGASIPQGIPEDVEGKYAPRMILEQLLHGINRTYIYELIDEGKDVNGPEGNFGLARRDGSRKPAFLALKNLISTMSDRTGAPNLQNLEFTLAGGSANVHHLLFQKADGSYYLAFWVESSDFDVNKRLPTPVPMEKVTFQSNRVFKTTQLLSFGQDGSIQTTQLTPGSQIPLQATDCLSILRLM